MDTKLTLKLDSETIEKIKAYAKKKHQTLSDLVENYFENLTYEKSETSNSYTPIVRQLAGKVRLPKNFEFKRKYVDYLIKKHK